MPRRSGLLRLARQGMVWFVFAVILVSTGLFHLFAGRQEWLGIILIIAGLGGGVYQSRRLFMKMIRLADNGGGMSNGSSYPMTGPRIVTIGGGTGLGTILRGLKKITPNLTAIVTVADDGGSSGRLREEFGILPPGDIRSCLIAMANLEPLMEQLMQFRFNGGSGLSGHNFGNLFLTAMTGITGDFEKAIEASSQVLAVRGRVYPATLANVTLSAELNDGTVINGETAIGYSNRPIRRVFLQPPDAKAVPEAVKAIQEADVVILGPGSLYTSVIPPLLVREVAEAVRKTKALRVYICNVMTQPGETKGFTASDHLQAIMDNAGAGLVDYVVLNTQEVPAKARAAYAEEGAEPVLPDQERIIRMGLLPVTDLLLQTNCVVRHNADRVAQLILKLFRAARQEKNGCGFPGRVREKIKTLLTKFLYS